MGRKGKKSTRPARRASLDVTIGGEGISPASVPIRALAEVLQAAASVAEAVARSKALPAPELHLRAVRVGSAAYELESASDDAGAVLRDVYEAAKERGKHAPLEVRRALRRFHAEASKLGSLRIRAHRPGLVRAPKEITVAPPVAEPEGGVEEYAEVFGRLVGLRARADGRVEVQLRLAEGRTEDFFADEAILPDATRSFNEDVRAVVLYSDDGEERRPLNIESLIPWISKGEDFVAVAAAVRSELEAEGVVIDSSEWLREIRRDD